MAEAIVTAGVIALSTVAIGVVYLHQYEATGSRRPLFVAAHLVAVSAIIVSYWWVVFLQFPRVPNPVALSGGIALFVGGSFVFWWASVVHKTSLVPDPQAGLAANGPYEWIRHPIYTGGLLGAAGLLLVSPSAELLLDFAVLLASIAALAYVEEREVVARLPEYASYQRRTAAFLPRPRVIGDLARAFVAISRFEYLGAGVFFLVIVAAIGSGTLEALEAQRDWVALGCALWVFCHLLGSQVNCLADQDVDADSKPQLPTAIATLGAPVVWALIWFESVAALAIAIAFAVVKTHDATPVVLYAVGWAVAMAYSVRPFRLKGRALWSPLSLLAVLYVLPVAFGYLALAGEPEPTAVLLLASVGVQILAIILMNPVADIPEDRAHGLRTPAVVFGIRPLAAVAGVCYLLGSIAALALALSLLGPGPVPLAVCAASALGHLWVLWSLAHVYRKGPELSASADGRRALERLNPKQFAVLGASIAAVTICLLGTSNV